MDNKYVYRNNYVIQSCMLITHDNMVYDANCWNNSIIISIYDDKWKKWVGEWVRKKWMDGGGMKNVESLQNNVKMQL